MQRPELINLALNMIKASGNQELTIIQEKSDKFNVLSEKANFIMHIFHIIIEKIYN